MNKYTYRINNENNGITLVENIFINEFMPYARGEYVKVYLYGLKLTQYPTRTLPTDEELAEILNLSVTDVINAWQYWERQGLIKKKALGETVEIIFYNISENRLSDNREPSFTVTKEIPVEYEDAIEKIEEMIGQEITPELFKSIKLWILEYNFTPMLITYLIEYSLNRLDRESPVSAKMGYFNRVASNWHDEGISDYYEAIESSKRFQQEHKLAKKVLEYLGIRDRSPMQSEYNAVKRWLNEYEFSEEMILEAASRTSVSNINYVNSILKNWYESGWQKISDIKDFSGKKKNSEETPQPVVELEEDLYAAYR